MKPCNYISESIVLVTPATGTAYKAKLVTEYGRDADGGLIVVSTRYVNESNAVITLGVTDTVEVVQSGQPVTAQDKCLITTEQAICSDKQNLRMVTEYGFDATGGLIVVSTRYVNAENEVVTPIGIVYGECVSPTFPEGIVCYDVGGVIYSAQTLNGVTTWTDADSNPVEAPDLTNAEIACCPQCSTQCVDYYSAVHTLAAGTTIIPHNLNLKDPNAFLIELWSEIDGDFVHPQITATTANSLTLTSTVEATNIRVTVKSAQSCTEVVVGGGETIIPVSQDGTQVTSQLASLNFTGATVTDDGAGNVTVAIDAAPALIVNDEGVLVEDATSSLNFTGNVETTTDGAGNVTVNVPFPPTYAQVVYTNTASPSTSTIFDLNTPATVNNPTLAQNSANLYIGSDGSTWIWNGTTYVTEPVKTATEWDLIGTTTDAGRNTTSIIQRYADVTINGIRVGRGGGSVQTNTLLGGGGALLANTTGDNNVALGEYALGMNTTGGSNFGMGFASLGGNISGSFNVGLGRASLRWSKGSYNIGIGMQAMSGSGMTGNNNIGIGWLSASALTTGANNINIGSASGGNITSGSRNLSLGTDARPISPTASNQVSIANSLFAINASATDPAAPSGSWGVNITAPNSTLDVGGSFGAVIRVNGGNLTMNATDYSVIMQGAGTTYTLLAPASNTRRVINVRNTSAGVVTVSGHIDGVAGASLSIPAGGARTLHSDGSTWYVISGL